MNDPKLFWKNHLDGVWNCEVSMVTDQSGVLTMSEIETGRVVMRKDVAVSRYFRTDDIIYWGNLCMIQAAKMKR
jgi:hypothetical protein